MTIHNRIPSLAWLLGVAAIVSCSDSGTDTQPIATAGQSSVANGGSTAIGNNSAGATATAGQTSTMGQGGTPAVVTPPATGGTPAASGGMGTTAMAGTAPMNVAGATMNGMGGMSNGQAGAGSGGAGTGTLYEGPFTCSQYIGAYLSQEWYLGGNFEDKLEALGGDGDTWQLKWHHHGYVTWWADPNSPFWADDGDPNNDNSGSPIVSACAQNSDAPDRVIMLVIDWEMLTEADWITALEDLVSTLQLKYPSAKVLELMTLIRCPNNTMCNGNADYGEGANLVAGRQDCYVQPYVDSAIEKVAAAHPDLVKPGPKIEAQMCNPNIDGAHLGGENNNQAASDLAAYYAP